MQPIKLLNQKWNPPKDPDTSFAGKTIIVTGASSGLGYEAALKFARNGASKVILSARDASKGQAALQKIQSQPENGKAIAIEVWELEMGDYESIKAFVEKVETLERLDVVVLNAGVLTKDFKKSKYGWETTLQINVLSTALLALLLLPKLQKSKTTDSIPVLEFVSSGLYATSSAPLDGPLAAWNKAEGYNFQTQYNASKFLVQCCVKALAKISQPIDKKEPDVIVLGVCPGACRSDLGRDLMTSLPMRIAAAAFQALLTRTTEEGARSFVSGVVQGPDSNGGFWQHDLLHPDAAVISGDDGERMVDMVWSDVLDALKEGVPELASVPGPLLSGR